MNGARNIEFARRAPDGGAIAMPVLFLHAEHDYVCETVASRLAEPMRRDCRDLTGVTVASGHWMAQETGAIKWVGVLYMLYLGGLLLRSARWGEARVTRPLTFWQSAMFQYVNPKAWMLARPRPAPTCRAPLCRGALRSVRSGAAPACSASSPGPGSARRCASGCASATACARSTR